MLLQSLILLFIHFTVLLFSRFLSVDNFEESVTFRLGLICKHDFSLQELPLARNFKFIGLPLTLLCFISLLSAGLTLTLLKSPLRSQCVNLSLPIRSFLLKLPKPLDFLLFLVLHALLLSTASFFLSIFSLIVTDNFHFFIFLSLNLSLFRLLRLVIAHFDFCHHLLVLLLFDFC